MKKTFFKTLFSLVLLFGLTTTSHAAGLVPCGNTGEPRCELNDFFSLIVKSFTFVVFDITTPLAILMVVIGGVYMVVSAGRSAMIDKGKQIIFWSIAAWLLIFCSYLIVNTLLDAIGYNLPRSI